MSKLLVDEISPKTSGNQVVFPEKPAWRIGLSAQQDVNLVGLVTVEWDSTNNDTRYHYLQNVTLSSYKIVVPVAGLYQVNSNIRVDSVGGGYLWSMIVINEYSSSGNTTYTISGTPSTSYENLTSSDVFKLEANDEVWIRVGTQIDGSWHIDDRSTFSGVLVG